MALSRPEKTVPRRGADRRLEFIDFRLYWEGRINRSDLTDFFGISVPQASLDLAKYLSIAPENATYDKSQRTYTASESFKPIYTNPASEGFLNQLLAIALNISDKSNTFIGWLPSFGVTKMPSRWIQPHLLFHVLTAIRAKTCLRVNYQSMTRSTPTSRHVSPHALAFDGFRWHVRAYCHTHNEFRDFVLARILAVEEESPSDIDPTADILWERIVQIQIGPNPVLPEVQRKAIELDYSMVSGSAILEVRAALAFYLLRHLGFELNGEPNHPESHHIVLLNWSEVSAAMAAAKSE